MFTSPRAGQQVTHSATVKKVRWFNLNHALTNTGGKADERHVIGSGDELAITLAIVEALMNNPTSKGSSAEKEEFRKVLSSKLGLNRFY